MAYVDDVVESDDDLVEILPPADDEIKVLGTKRTLETSEEETPLKKRRKEDPPKTGSSGSGNSNVEIELIEID